MASEMKSAGKAKASAEPGRCGKPTWAAGMEPESNQASITGSTRRQTDNSSTSSTAPTSPAHVPHTNVTSSMVGRCGSIPVTSRPHSSDSSRSDPTQRTCPRPQRQIGSGVPQ